jgi:hypothetical protein
MKKALVLLLGVCFVALFIGSVAARDVANPGLRTVKSWSESEYSEANDPGLRGLYEEAAVDTYCLVWYTFEQMNWMGWTKTDETAQAATFFHVDDFAGLGGGAYGMLVPLEGTKSMWCGARPSSIDPYLCSWYDAPGYGNGWNQLLGTTGFSFVGSITLSYIFSNDTEPDYDYTRVEYDAGGGNWQQLAEYTDVYDDDTASIFLATTQARTKIRFHMTADGAWSDQDGLYNTDGAFIVDQILLVDAGALNNYQDFELAPVGATSAGIWIGAPEAPYGSYAGLKNNLDDKDPCGDNFATQLVYFLGSPNPSTSYPGLFDTPYCMGPGGLTAPCQSEIAVSPVIDMTKYSTLCNNVQNADIPPGDLPLLGGSMLRLTVYRDLPKANLVFYQWHVRSIVSGCPGQWKDRNYVYYGPDMDYIYSAENISNFLGTNDPVQIGMGCVDMCDVWYLVEGNCAIHTPSPWIDNVRLYRFKTAGPQWAMRDLDLFQDNFPELEFQIESYVRADAANDINPTDNPILLPGDTVVVDATSLLGGGIGTDPTFGGPAVYIHVLATYVGPGSKPVLSGAPLAGSTVTGPIGSQYTINFNYVGMSGAWTVIQCDTARTAGGIQRDRYMVDLNDDLFTRGYYIEYYFTAKDAAAVESSLPRWARSRGPYYEFLCLPTGNSDVLFVDDCTGRGSFNGAADDYWTPVFDAVLAIPNNNVDKYDVNGPSSSVSNGPGSRAKTKHLVDYYYKIVWDSGELESTTISDGTVNSDKSNDCQMIINWFEQSEHTCGLWVCGDDVAYDLAGLASTPALTLMSQWCGVDYVANSYFDETGGRTGGGTVTPLLTGDLDASFGAPAGYAIFVHAGVPDKFYAYGGCFVINQFDVLEKTAFGKYAASYPVKDATNRYGAIASSQPNPGGFEVRTMWFGFSYQYVRDDVVSVPMDRFELARDVFSWMQNITNGDVTDAPTPPKTTKLTQNFPNPFNPSTQIKFDLKEKGYVTLKVYNVAGQLVRTLVSGVRDASSYTITWDGKNDRGGAVASGIYFYKMDTKDFSQTKKMVMLR